MPAGEEEKREHPNVEYIKREDIGMVISKGLAVTYKMQPKNPIDFMAKWLLQYASIEKDQI
jgi:hypothetical protein